MAEDKKSILLYCDIIHTVEHLEDEQAGRLFKHYLRYINDLNPVAPDKLTEIVFEPIKRQLNRDLIKWKEFREKQSKNGKLGGRPNNPSLKKENPNNPSLVSESQKSLTVTVTDTVKAKVTDTVTVNVTDNVTVIKKEDIDGRKLKFANTLKPFSSNYDRNLLNDFYKYWTEPNKSNTKFRQELQKTWDLSRRLEGWAKNDKYFNNNKNGQQPSKVDGYKQSAERILRERGIDPNDYIKQPDSI